MTVRHFANEKKLQLAHHLIVNFQIFYFLIFFSISRNVIIQLEYQLSGFAVMLSFILSTSNLNVAISGRIQDFNLGGLKRVATRFEAQRADSGGGVLGRRQPTPSHHCTIQRLDINDVTRNAIT